MKMGEQPTMEGDSEWTFSWSRSEPYWFMSVFNKVKKLNFFVLYGRGRCKGGIRVPPTGMMLRGEKVYPEKGLYSTSFFVKKIVG